MKAVFYIILLLAISGCGIVNKFKERRKVKTNVETVSDANTTTIQDIDTLVNLPAHAIEFDRPLADLLQQGFISADDGLINVLIEYDKVTGKIKTKAQAKARNVPVKLHTVTHTKSHEVKKTNTKESIKNSTVHKKKLSAGWSIFFSVLILGGLIWLAFYLEKRN